jgi:hypothetical protein
VRRFLGFVILILTLVIPWTAGATIVKSFSTAGMTAAAHDIVRGFVVAQEAVYDSKRKHVYTHTTVRVEEDLSRPLTRPLNTSRLIIVRQLGGATGGIQSVLVGNARLELGEEVVLFARTDGVFHYLVGMAQGKYSVWRSGNGPPKLRRSLQGIVTIRPSHIARPQAANLLSLAALRHMVKSALKEEASR